MSREPLLEPMHYWPPGGATFACSADHGFRSSSPDSVTCPDCKPAAALADRRQRAREAYYDELSGGSIESGTDPVDVFAEALDAAIETATRVRITPELLATMDPAIGNREARLRAAFEAAGFEVEQ